MCNSKKKFLELLGYAEANAFSEMDIRDLHHLMESDHLLGVDAVNNINCIIYINAVESQHSYDERDGTWFHSSNSSSFPGFCGIPILPNSPVQISIKEAATPFHLTREERQRIIDMLDMIQL